MMYPEANREICGMGKTEKENYMEYGGFAKDLAALLCTCALVTD